LTRDMLSRLRPEHLPGAIALDTGDGVVWPRRAGRAARDAFADRPAQLDRIHCCTGMRLAFDTDAVRIRLVLVVGRRARPWGGLDIRVDGDLEKGGRFRYPIWPSRIEIERDLGEAGRMKRVEVGLPHSAEVGIAGLELDGFTRMEPLPRPAHHLLALGDSITQGMVAWSPFAPWPDQLGEHLGLSVWNRGIGGHVFEPASVPDDLPAPPDLVLVAYGTNDWTQGIPDIPAGAYLDTVSARFPDAQVGVLTPLWRSRELSGEQVGGRTLGQIREIIREAATDRGFEVFEGPDLLPPGPRWLADGTHPHDLGFAILADRWASALRARGMVAGGPPEPSRSEAS